MAAQLIDYLEQDDIRQLPEEMYRKLREISQLYYEALDSSDLRAEEACRDAVTHLQTELSQTTQRRIELEMELLKCRTDLAASPRPSDEQHAMPVARGRAASRREAVILRGRLRRMRELLAASQRSEKHLSTQNGGILEDGGCNEAQHEEYKTVTLELAAYRQLREENRALKEKEGIYQADIFSKANEILHLERDNGRLATRAAILEQHRAKYAELHDRYIRSVLEQSNLGRQVADLKETLLRREAFYSQCLQKFDMGGSIGRKLDGMVRLLHEMRGNGMDGQHGAEACPAPGLESVDSVAADVRRINLSIRSFQNDFAFMVSEGARITRHLAGLINCSARKRGDAAPSAEQEMSHDLLVDDRQRLLDECGKYEVALASMEGQCRLSRREAEELASKCEDLSSGRQRADLEIERLKSHIGVLEKKLEASPGRAARRPEERGEESGQNAATIASLRSEAKRRMSYINKQARVLSRYRKLKNIVLEMRSRIESAGNYQQQ